jgi:hypothetical protein
MRVAGAMCPRAGFAGAPTRGGRLRRGWDPDGHLATMQTGDSWLTRFGGRRMSEGLEILFQKGPARTRMSCGLAGLLWMAVRAGANAEVVPDAIPSPETNRIERQAQDLLEVQTLQLESLHAQQGQDSTAVRRQNKFTGWLDETHQRWFRRLDNAVRWVDTRWLAEDAPYDHELSTFLLRTIARVGGRGSEGDADLKVRIRADLALPGLERKLRLIVDNADLDALPGADPLKQKNDTRVEARVLLRPVKDSELGAGGGLKWRHSNPVGYVDLDWRWECTLGRGNLYFNPKGYYFTDDGFGQMTTLTWMKQVGERQMVQIRTAERTSESLEGVEFEQTVRFAWFRSGRGRGWVTQASVFPQLVSSDWVWENALLNVTWRDSLYRKWIYYSITPQVEFPREDGYAARPSIRVGLEILLGGKIGALM